MGRGLNGRSITGMENANTVIPGPQLPPTAQFLPTENTSSSLSSSQMPTPSTGVSRLGMEDRLKDIFRF